MNFKKQLAIAIAFHKDETGEVIKYPELAKILWDKSNYETQRTRMSQSKKNGIDLKVNQVNALRKSFPDIPDTFWLGDVKIINIIKKLNLARAELKFKI